MRKTPLWVDILTLLFGIVVATVGTAFVMRLYWELIKLGWNLL